MLHSSVRVMSFNVRYDTDSDGRDAWPNRRDAVVRLLRYHRPDVICLQEPLPHQFASVREAIDRYEWFGVGRAGGGEGEFVPVGYDADRFEREDAAAFWLSETPDEPGSVGWDADYPRVVTRVTLRNRETGDRLHAASVHLDHGGARARAEGASLLRRRLGELDGPLVVAGDFNCEPDSTPYRRVVGDDGGGSDGDGTDAPPLRDARTLADEGHHGPERTFHGFTGDPTERIDYVFVRDCDVSLTATLTDRRSDDGDERYPSDHFPVAADVVPR
ncbi:endonuclease/exonuclease/phosphatase family protein [Halopelagius longus]|uniref:Metal-dependent hydrolase n=1 Tax=Halopelagius longus TaxID=1236180 RepID=A0A1H0YY84_9EURY|nr:endonuclease/exonuclease/phosphatase family protein [Halopelagius longus]RDI72734.1 metal-dependent hydrolase [Halopelagius longus]SDQ20155.1 Metal-dependent hydrolase, endonuclease/exonuclease/phosphatase family [Halopelagius longus]